jgi:hypothetical protein
LWVDEVGEYKLMGYISYWEWKYERRDFWHINPLKESFLKEVEAVIEDYKVMLRDITVTSEKIAFNGIDGYGCETFVFYDNGGSHSIKTGTFFSAHRYDVVVSSVLLLAKVHYREKVEIDSSGLSTIYVDEETLKVCNDWEDALKYVEEKFGYTFKRTFFIDEYNQEKIMLECIEEGSVER